MRGVDLLSRQKKNREENKKHSPKTSLRHLQPPAATSLRRNLLASFSSTPLFWIFTRPEQNTLLGQLGGSGGSPRNLLFFYRVSILLTYSKDYLPRRNRGDFC